MNTKYFTFYPVLLLLLALSVFAQNMDAFTPMKQQKRKIKVDPNLPLSPLVSPDEGRDLGVFYLFEVFSFTLTVQNPTDTPIEYTEIAINCSCTSTKIPPKGIIPAHGELKLPLIMNANKLRSLGALTRRVTIGCKNYQPFVINFTCFASDKLTLNSIDKETGEKQIFSGFPVGYVPGYFSDWECAVDLVADLGENDPVLELGDPIKDPQFVCTLTKTDEKNHFKLLLKPRLPQKYGAIFKSVVIPITNTTKEKAFLMIPIHGVSGCKLVTSTDGYIPYPVDENGKSQIISFGLRKEAHIDQFAALALFRKQPNPYERFIKPLREDEVVLPQVAGVTFTIKDKNPTGEVWVYCNVDTATAKIPPEGIEIVFKAQGCSDAYVTLISEPDYQKMKAQEDAEMDLSDEDFVTDVNDK